MIKMIDIKVFYKNKLIALLLILVVALVLCSCDIDYYKGQRPYDYPNTTWVCENADITYFAESNGGVIVFDGENIEYRFLWSILDSSVSAETLDGSDWYFGGVCKFNKNYFTIKVTVDNMGLGEAPYKLIFKRVK